MMPLIVAVLVDPEGVADVAADDPPLADLRSAKLQRKPRASLSAARATGY
jgi:hypothetical protein